MERSLQKPILHVLVCTRSKDRGESCGPKGASELRDTLKAWAKENYKTEIKVTASLCLGHCENGITVCIQPVNEWYLKVSSTEDLPALKERILQIYDDIKTH